MANNVPTRGEIERTLSQSIQAFYRNQLSCRVGKINCHILGDYIAIAIENPITSLERLLNNSGDDKFMEKLRDRIDAVVKSELMTEIKNVLGVEVIDLTIDTTLSNSFTGVFALLDQKPEMREAKRSK